MASEISPGRFHNQIQIFLDKGNIMISRRYQLHPASAPTKATKYSWWTKKYKYTHKTSIEPPTLLARQHLLLYFICPMLSKLSCTEPYFLYGKSYTEPWPVNYKIKSAPEMLRMTYFNTHMNLLFFHFAEWFNCSIVMFG